MSAPDWIWRVVFDVPVEYSIEPGYVKSQHCADIIAAGDIAPSNTYKDPVSGLIMLTPSLFSSNYTSGFVDSSQWTFNSGFIAPVKRAIYGNDFAAMMRTTLPAGTDSSGIAISSGINYFAYDNTQLVAAAQSTAEIYPADGAFALHYHGVGDELQRMDDWLSVAFGNLQIHFDGYGNCRVYQFPISTEFAPFLIDQFQICNPGELINKSGYFYFLPVPKVGLLVYHSLSPQRGFFSRANANSGTLRGHLVPANKFLYEGEQAQGQSYYTWQEQSKVTIFLNKQLENLNYVFGYQNITFATSGTYTDSIIDPGYVPTNAPSTVAAVPVPTVQETITANLLNAGGTSAWSTGTDRQGRVQLSLSTSDPTHTPFVFAYNVQWQPVTATRDTSPVYVAGNGSTVDTITRLEFSETEYRRFDGSVDILVRSAAMLPIMFRSDTTFELQKSSNGGITWVTHNGGMAKLGGPAQLEIFMGLSWYRTNWVLADRYARLNEIHNLSSTAFDGLNLGAAGNLVLSTSGEFPVATIPAGVSLVSLPSVPNGAFWRFAPRLNDGGEQIIKALELLLRKRNTEWMLYFNWPSQQWLWTQKTYDMSVDNQWTVTPFKDEESYADKSIQYMTLDVQIDAPESNETMVWGIDEKEPVAVLATSTPTYNSDSISDPSSVDYLGRVKLGIIAVPELTATTDEEQNDASEINRMNRRFYDSVAHRRMQPTVTVRTYIDSLVPMTYLTIRTLNPSTGERGNLAGMNWSNPNDGVEGNFWVKRRQLIVEQDGKQTFTIECSDIWTGEFDR